LNGYSSDPCYRGAALSDPTPESPSLAPSPGSPAVAGFLSFLFPGLGQLYVRRRRAAAVFAVPVLALTALVAVQSLGGIQYFAAQLIDPTFALAALIVLSSLGLWRLISIGHAALIAEPPGRRMRPQVVMVMVILGLAVVIPHGVASYYAWSFYDAGKQIFQADALVPAASPGPLMSAGTTAVTSPSPSDNGTFETPATALPSPTADRVTFLLTGVDSGHDRAHALTDTMLVASIDRQTKKAVMLSIPRDISNFPLYSGGKFRGKINSLMSAAGNDPKRFPDGPVLTLTREIGYLIGVPINYYAAINLDGFQKMVDLVGGVDIVNPKQIDDPRYDWFDGTSGYKLSPGPHHLNGRNALAYVRSRQGVGDSDFTRAARQQQVLVALRAKLGTAALLEKLPDLLKVAAKTIRTDFPPGQVRDYLELANEVSDTAIVRHVLGPPYAVHPPTGKTGGIYTLVFDFKRLSKLSIKLFGDDSSYKTGAPGSAPTVPK
jgi:polyisoprenyl-teichoic acid--peptidoglycan teichoic acid transferase